jgi:hypothetical protein
MATKAELIAYGEAHGVAVDDSMLKADIEAALRDAGYDPETLSEGEDVMSEPDAPATTDADPAEEFAKSSQAHFSTYSENTDVPDENPPLGRHVVQERGEPSEGEVTPTKGIAD